MTEMFRLTSRTRPAEALKSIDKGKRSHGLINAITICPKQPNKTQNDKPKEEEEKDNLENIHVNPLTLPDPSVSFITEKVLKLNSFFKSLGLVPQSFDTEVVCTKGDDDEVMFIEIIRKNDDSHEEGPEEEGSTTTEGVGVEHFDMFPTRSELAYQKYLMCGPIPFIFLRNPIITEGCPSFLKIPCNIGHVHFEKAYIDVNSPLNVMTQMMYNWIMRRKLDPSARETFTKISNMTYDPPEGVVRFTNKNDEIAYKMPHKIERYNSLSDLKKEHTKSVYLRNEEDKRKGVKYVINKILGFYKECLELGPEYVTGMDDEGEVT
ncbi:hypothetical protein Tco_0878041 [Tanacetum coccineum]|uniref:Uncharacterized protein n=1 Tax=Tanacetum coccineum TaxID=301880 RepID=A0ABQ5BWS7_9ASTR